MAGISIRGMEKSYGSYSAIKGIDLEIGDGEFCVFLGPSGCGKTTTLNCIAGLETVSRGEVFLGDRRVTDLSPHQRDIAMVFQSALLYPHLTARENLSMSLRHVDVDAVETQRRIDHAVKILEIGALLKKKPSEMSGGERQRVAIAKAIVRDPVCFLMDEPLAALDASLRQSLRVELVHLQKSLGVTTAFVTHDQVEAMTMGDKIVVMNAGRIEQVGTPAQIYNRPATRFVAGFVGVPSMNFFDGVIQQGSDGLVFQYKETIIGLPDAMRETVAEVGTAVSLGVRPQHLKIAETSAADTVRLRVYSVEHLGRENVVILEDTDATRFRMLVDADINVKIGDVLHVAITAERAHLYRSSEGAR